MYTKASFIGPISVYSYITLHKEGHSVRIIGNRPNRTLILSLFECINFKSKITRVFPTLKFTGSHTMAAKRLTSLSKGEFQTFFNSFDVVLSDCDGL